MWVLTFQLPDHFRILIEDYGYPAEWLFTYEFDCDWLSVPLTRALRYRLIVIRSRWRGTGVHNHATRVRMERALQIALVSP